MEKQKKYSIKQIRLFFIIVVVLSIICETVIIVNKAMGLAVFLMWVPALAAVIASLSYKKENKTKLNVMLGFKKTHIKYILQAIVIPFLYIGIPYGVYWMIDPENIFIENYKTIIFMAIAGLFISLFTALGEEIGWRGFMFPALFERLGSKKTLLITSIIWVGWHIPIIVCGLYMPGTPIYYTVPAFAFCIVPVAIIAGILTIKSKSVWPAAFLHASHNNFDQAVFAKITFGKQKMLFVSETGVFTIICAWIIAIYLYVKFISSSNEESSAC